MPRYLFQHPKTEETIEVTQGMKEEHVYIDESGIKWNRVFTKPHAAIKNNLINADTSEQDFVRKTSEKNYSLGEMWDLSAELSQKRKRVHGNDPIKEKEKKKYEQRTGKKHPHSGGGEKQSDISI